MAMKSPLVAWCWRFFKLLPPVLAALGGCVVAGSYPRDWPEKADERPNAPATTATRTPCR